MEPKTIIILGTGGSGKSTLRQLCHLYYNLASKNETTPNKSGSVSPRSTKSMTNSKTSKSDIVLLSNIHAHNPILQDLLKQVRFDFSVFVCFDFIFVCILYKFPFIFFLCVCVCVCFGCALCCRCFFLCKKKPNCEFACFNDRKQAKKTKDKKKCN